MHLQMSATNLGERFLQVRYRNFEKKTQENFLKKTLLL